MLKALTRILPIAGLLLLAAAPARAADEKQVKEAIERGVNYLKNNFAPAGGAQPGAGGGPLVVGGAGVGGTGPVGPGEGPAALAGIALLEAGVGRDDPAVQTIATQIRNASIPQNATYQLSLDIIFLDKLGEQIDTVLIQSMAVRLLYGQNIYGGWSYRCPQLMAGEQARLRELLRGAGIKGGKDAPTTGTDPDNRPKLDPVIQDMIKNKSNLQWAEGGPAPNDDNSNTQFAVIALWSARKYGVPVNGAFEAINTRFRRSQAGDGGWGYIFPKDGTPSFSTPPMTCAGLLGLAVVTGSRTERSMKSKGSFGASGKFEKKSTEDAAAGPPPQHIAGDVNIQAGLRYLAAALAGNNRGAGRPNPGAGGLGPVGAGGPGAGGPRRPPGAGMPAGGPGVPAPGAPPGNPGAGIPPAGGLPGGGGVGEDLRPNLYFLWSLERTCMVYNLAKIGDFDWHDWGAKYLIGAQRIDGSWQGQSGHYSDRTIDTAFALMFMCRANLVRDLSKIIERSMENKPNPKVDPKKSVAKGGAPSADTGDAESTKLAQDLVKAGAGKQIALIEEYKSEKSKGAKFTLALAAAIRLLKDDAKTAARDGLAERMARMNGDTLKKYMDADDPELSRAACLGVAMRDERSLIPELIKHLDDTDEIVWRAAALALKTISGEDFGPKKGATDSQRDKAIKEWKAWYEKAQKSGENTEKTNKN